MSYERGDSDAPFNMAVATLMRLDKILQQMRQLHITFQNKVQRQKLHIELVKQFYLNSITLLDDSKKENREELEKIEKQVLNFKMDKKSNVKSGNQKFGECYSEEKEIELNKIMIKLQKQLKKYFMPSGKDRSSVVSQLN